MVQRPSRLLRLGEVRAEFERILRFWFDRGVGGFRIDVAHALIKDRLLRNGERFMRNRPEALEIYARWQEIAAEYEPKRTFMGETYVRLSQLWLPGRDFRGERLTPGYFFFLSRLNKSPRPFSTCFCASCLIRSAG